MTTAPTGPGLDGDPGDLFGVDIPVARTLGIFGTEVGDDRATLTMRYDAAYANSRGDVSGGALTVLLDCALAAAVRAHDPAAFGVVTVDLVTHFVAPCRGTAIATAVCERRGRTLSVARGEVHDENGTLAAVATGTFVLVARRPATAGPVEAPDTGKGRG